MLGSEREDTEFDDDACSKKTHDLGSVSTVETISEPLPPIEACPVSLIFKRGIFLTFLCGTLVVALACRFLIPLDEYFPSFCLLRSNHSLVPVPSSAVRAMDPAKFAWIDRDCIRVIP